MESPDNSSAEHPWPFSQRTVALASGLIASVAALALLLGGCFHPLDLVLKQWLGLVSMATRFPIGVHVFVVLLGGFGAAWIALNVRLVSARRLLLAVTVLQPISGSAVAALGRGYFSPFAALFAIGLAIVAAMIFRGSAPGLRHRRLEATFGKHVSAATLEVLARGSGSYQATLTTVTALVCRFESPGTEDLSEAAAFFKSKGAWVEEQAGNRLLVLFNVPAPKEKHALAACSAALEFMQERPRWRIGLAVGDVTTGIAEGNSIFRVNGLVIDEADVICRANSRLRTAILASLKAFDAVSQDVVARPVDLMQSAITNEKTEVYELLSLAESASPELLARRDRFWEGVILSRRGENREAAECFRELSDDSVALSFLKRLEVDTNETETARAAN